MLTDWSPQTLPTFTHARPKDTEYPLSKDYVIFFILKLMSYAQQYHLQE